MRVKRKRLSVAATPDVSALLDGARKELFSGRSRSEVIRELVRAGIRSSQPDRSAKRAETGPALAGDTPRYTG